METMHASSFDTHLDASYWMGSEAGRATPGNVFYESDNESGASYITGIFLPVDPDSLRDAASQTPGYAKTQTMDLPPTLNRSFQTQTATPPRNAAMQTSTTSLHSIGAQTKRRSGSRADLLRSILLEVKDIKKQQGVDTSDVESIASDATIRKETLEALYRDVAALRNAGAQGTAATQTAQEQATQTAMRMFPDGDAQQQARQDRLQGMLAEIRTLRGEGDETSATPSRPHSTPHSLADLDQRTPSRSLTRTTPARFESPVSSPTPTSRAAPTPTPTSAVNGYNAVRFAYPPETSHSMPALHQPPVGAGNYGHRRVTQNDLNAISDRLDRLQSYQLPSRRQLPIAPLPPPPLPPPVVQMPPPPPARRYRVRNFTRSYDDLDALSDDSDYGGGRGRRRGRGHHSAGDVRSRYHLDDALEEANNAARELKRLSSKMKRNLRDELGKHSY